MPTAHVPSWLKPKIGKTIKVPFKENRPTHPAVNFQVQEVQKSAPGYLPPINPLDAPVEDTPHANL